MANIDEITNSLKNVLKVLNLCSSSSQSLVS